MKPQAFLSLFVLPLSLYCVCEFKQNGRLVTRIYRNFNITTREYNLRRAPDVDTAELAAFTLGCFSV